MGNGLLAALHPPPPPGREAGRAQLAEALNVPLQVHDDGDVVGPGRAHGPPFGQGEVDARDDEAHGRHLEGVLIAKAAVEVRDPGDQLHEVAVLRRPPVDEVELAAHQPYAGAGTQLPSNPYGTRAGR